MKFMRGSLLVLLGLTGLIQLVETTSAEARESDDLLRHFPQRAHDTPRPQSAGGVEWRLVVATDD
jgi:hypothetical protein